MNKALQEQLHTNTWRIRDLCARYLARTGDLFMPPACASCQVPVTRHAALCAACWRDIAFIQPPICDVLGIPMPFDPGGRIVSAGALAEPPAYDRARAVAAYGDTMRTLILGMKYADRLEHRQLFSRWLIAAGGDLWSECDLIVPVPLHRWRLFRRAFNQAALLATDIAAGTNLPVDMQLLQRVKNTTSQVRLTLNQRQRNVAGAFKVNRRGGKTVSGRNVLVIDDVITTGATVSACARALKRAGAARVDILALARVVDPARAYT